MFGGGALAAEIADLGFSQGSFLSQKGRLKACLELAPAENQHIRNLALSQNPNLLIFK